MVQSTPLYWGPVSDVSSDLSNQNLSILRIPLAPSRPATTVERISQMYAVLKCLVSKSDDGVTSRILIFCASQERVGGEHEGLSPIDIQRESDLQAN